MNRDINCERVEPDLTGYLLGALPAAREAELRTHLETCERCRATAKELADTLDLLRGALAASPSTPAALSPERRAKVLTARRPKMVEAWHTWMYPVARAALLLLVPAVLLAALMLPALQGGRQRAMIIGKLAAEPAAEIDGAYTVAPAATAPAPAAPPMAGQGGGGGGWDTRHSVWSLERAPEAAPAETAAPVSTRAAPPASTMARNGVTLRNGRHLEGEVRDLGNGEVRLTTEAGARMHFRPGQLAEGGRAAAPAEKSEAESLGRSYYAYSDDAIRRGAAQIPPADPFATADRESLADASGLRSDAWKEGDRREPARKPAGGPAGGSTFASGGYVAGLGAPAGQVADAKYHGGSANSVSEVRKRLEERFDKDADGVAIDALAAAAPDAAGKEVYVPLRPAMPKPAFVGTPVPAKAPNLEPPGARQTFDLPAAVAEGRAVVMSGPAAAPAATPAPAAPPAPPPAAQPVPALGEVPVLGSLFGRSSGSVRGRDGSESGEKAKVDLGYHAGDMVINAGTAGLKDMNGRNEPQTEMKPGSSMSNEEVGKDATVLRGLMAGRTDEPRAKELDKAGSGGLMVGGGATYGGVAIVNGSTVAAAPALPAADSPDAGAVAPAVVAATAKKRATGLSAMHDDYGLEVGQKAQAAVEEQKKGQQALGLARELSEEKTAELRDELLRANAPADHAKVPPEPAVPPKFTAAGFNPVVDARENAFSTFSIDVDTASYAMARRAILEGRRPEPESVRTEEFVNSFDYDYAPPASGTFAIHLEGAPSPFRKSFDLLKIGVKAQRIGRDRHRGAVLTFVVDTSGSMNTEDRLGMIRTSLRMLVERLAPEDVVSIVTFNNRAALALEPTPAAQKDAILAVIAGLETTGSTQLEGGLRLGYEVAARAFRGGASNRVILMSDGVANLGAADSAAILRAVEEHRKQGIYCTVLGFGTGTYDDTMLESLANKGDGTYAYIDSLDEARRVLVDELAATLHTVARDVKIQVEFNPERVKRWRQLGYENRRLEKEQFRDDTVDAGEVGSGQAVTALYDVELQGRPEQPVATVRVRYRNLETGAVEEIEQRVAARHFTRDFAAASPRFRLAAGVAEFAELLRMSPYTFSGGRDFGDVAGVIRPVALELRLDERVRELARLVQAAPSLPGP